MWEKLVCEEDTLRLNLQASKYVIQREREKRETHIIKLHSAWIWICRAAARDT